MSKNKIEPCVGMIYSHKDSSEVKYTLTKLWSDVGGQPSTRSHQCKDVYKYDAYRYRHTPHHYFREGNLIVHYDPRDESKASKVLKLYKANRRG